MPEAAPWRTLFSFKAGRQRLALHARTRCRGGSNRDARVPEPVRHFGLALGASLGQARDMKLHEVLVRTARLTDAQAVARIYVDSWRDTYPGILPTRALLGMDVERQAARWRNAIASPVHETVLVAEGDKGTIMGMTSLGRARDKDLGFDGEIYTLYVHPLVTGNGIGRTLLRKGFALLAERGCESCMIWAHAQNPARFFYQAMGGKLIAERVTCMMGASVPEAAFGWKTLALVETSRT